MLKPAALRLIAAIILVVLGAYVINTDRAAANTALSRICAVPPSAISTTTEADPDAITHPVSKLGSEVVGAMLILEVTGYTSTEAQTDNDPCIASDMSNICERKARGELLCAASRNFALGTRVHVEGLGTCTVVDYMNEKYVMHVDWYFGRDAKGDDTLYRRAKKVGRHYRKVRVASIPR